MLMRPPVHTRMSYLTTPVRGPPGRKLVLLAQSRPAPSSLKAAASKKRHCGQPQLPDQQAPRTRAIKQMCSWRSRRLNETPLGLQLSRAPGPHSLASAGARFKHRSCQQSLQTGQLHGEGGGQGQ